MPPPEKIKLGTYIDPLTDFGFKFLFSETNKDLLNKEAEKRGLKKVKLKKSKT